MSGPYKGRKMVQFIVGVDEAGRGPLAGPVSLGAVLARIDDMPKLRKVFREIKGKDSKKLSPDEREKWFGIIRLQVASGALAWKVAHSTPAVIDGRGLSYAIRSALSRALFGTGAKGESARVLLDGGLKAPVEFINQKTIIKGDEKELLISLASICAKVTRDRIMIRQSKYFPEYGFDEHKGYGTTSHRNNIGKFGLTEIHRASFCKSFDKD